MPRKNVDSKSLRPKSVLIGGLKVELVYKPSSEVLNDAGEEIYGQAIFQSTQILLDETLTERHLMAILFHEIQHYLLYIEGYNDGDVVTEEKLCNVSGFGMSSVLLSNPTLRQWVSAVARSK